MSRRRTQIRPFGDQAGYLLMILISIVASVLAHRGGQPAIAVAATADTGKVSTAPRAKEDDVVGLQQEVQLGEVEDHLLAERPLEAEVEVVQGLDRAAGRP